MNEAGIMKNRNVPSVDKVRWLWTGLIWGLVTFVLVEIIIGPLTGDAAISLKTFYIGIPIWTVAGLCFGLSMRWWESRKGGK